jgi:hypothetical protein
MKRVSIQRDESPYYFSYTAICLDGTRISQYDERSRLARWADIQAEAKQHGGMVKLEVYVHPAFMNNVPTYFIALQDGEQLEVEYLGTKAVEVNIPYQKQAFVVRSNLERCVSFYPNDW